MTTEEMLLKLSEQLERLTVKVDCLENDITSMKTDVSNMKSDITHMKTDITTIKLDTENHVKPMLQELIGYATSNSRRITMIEGRTEALEDENAINEVITEIKQKGMM